jgi:hypothetical protein
MSVRRSHTLKQLITAVRAFHIGLVAETERQLSTLRRLADSIEALRRPGQLTQKRAAVRMSLRDLAQLGRPSWQSTYRDLRRSLRQLYVGLDGKPADLGPRPRK